MGIVSIPDFLAAIPAQARVIALDLGDKRIGVAVGSLTSRIATPVEVVQRSGIKADAASIDRLARDYEAAGWVVGWPLNMDGTEGTRCQSVKDLTLALLQNGRDVPVAFWDERLSTVAAAGVLRDGSNLSGSKRAQIVDKHAAAQILQGFLDSL